MAFALAWAAPGMAQTTGMPAPSMPATMPAQTAPAAQVRPSNQPPVPPQVSYSNGQLTIATSNSTLADILDAVKDRTGARLELPPNAAQERVAVQIGPGNPRDVLDRLLYGSAFDYILLGSEENPTAVTQIIVKRREATNVAAGGEMGARPNPPPAQVESTEENTDSEAEQQPPPEPMPPQLQPAAQAPANIAPPTMQQAPEQNAAPGTTPGQNQVKTPQQLLQELQRMQQQEQQRRQGQTPPPPPPSE